MKSFIYTLIAIFLISCTKKEIPVITKPKVCIDTALFLNKLWYTGMIGEPLKFTSDGIYFETRNHFAGRWRMICDCVIVSIDTANRIYPYYMREYNFKVKRMNKDTAFIGFPPYRPAETWINK